MYIKNYYTQEITSPMTINFSNFVFKLFRELLIYHLSFNLHLVLYSN